MVTPFSGCDKNDVAKGWSRRRLHVRNSTSPKHTPGIKYKYVRAILWNRLWHLRRRISEKGSKSHRLRRTRRYLRLAPGSSATPPRTRVCLLTWSIRIVSIFRWMKLGSRYSKQFNMASVDGKSVAPTVRRLFNWIVDFSTADFQPRATYVLG